ncbi:MAG: GHKL domain-containing protein, partial [Gammaproteobacteria bacterium]|nr:GHKL domain-containing protein [Gammaproteobacteria bacterium]
ISRVLINLIKNATEAKKENNKLSIKIKSRVLKKEGIIRLTIIDDGNGFPEDIIDKVFEPYITTKEKSGGLGLAIVQNIIEQHDGQIFASNVKPHGARITIEFSIIDALREVK